MPIVQYRPKKESAKMPPNKHRRYDVPPDVDGKFEALALVICIVSTKYVTRFTIIAIEESLSHISIPWKMMEISMRIIKYSNFHF